MNISNRPVKKWQTIYTGNNSQLSNLIYAGSGNNHGYRILFTKKRKAIAAGQWRSKPDIILDGLLESESSKKRLTAN